MLTGAYRYQFALSHKKVTRAQKNVASRSWPVHPQSTRVPSETPTFSSANITDKEDARAGEAIVDRPVGFSNDERE